MKLLKKSMAVMLIVLTTITLKLSTYADDGVVGRTPEGVYPMNDTEVEMESEDILVDIEKFTAECTFVFHNTGEEKDVLMGFPGKLNKDAGSELTPDTNLSLNDFKTFVNGDRLNVKHEKGIQGDIGLPVYDEWYTFTVPFKKGERITVRNTYSFKPSYVSTGDVYTGYVLQTGATWKGSIGKARVEFKLGSIKPWQVELLNPGGFRFSENSIVWERQDFEPYYDLNLNYNTWRYSSEFLDSFAGEEKDRILAKIEKYKEIKQMAEKKDSEHLYNEYVKGVEEGNRMLAVYAASLITEEPMQNDSVVLDDISVNRESNGYHVDCNIRSLYTPNVVTQISHVENGETIIDHKSESTNPSVYMDFLPDIEYDISVTSTDWQDRTVKKETKYIVPARTLDQVKTTVVAENTSEAESTSEAGSTVETGSTAETGNAMTAGNTVGGERSTDESTIIDADFTESGNLLGVSGESSMMNVLWITVPVFALVCLIAGIVLYRRR